MPKHADQQHFNYTTVQLFELVSDVERYPEFLPWVKAVRITERYDHYFISDVVVHFKHITEQYTCRVDMDRPDDEHDSGEIHVSLVKGPFHHLVNHWRFEPAPDGRRKGCEVHFFVDFAFKTKFLDRIIGVLFGRATERMISAFSDRAKALYQ